MESLGGVFGELFAQRVGGKVIHQPGTHVFSKEQPITDASRGIAAPAQTETPTPAPDNPSPLAQPSSELTCIAGIFRANGEGLELIENRLKAKSGMDYVRRLTYLFLYAHELHGRDWPPRTALTAALKEGKILDPNTRFWLRKKQGFRVDADDRLQLIQAGREEAKKALSEVLDPNVADDWNPDKKVVTKRGPRKKKGLSDNLPRLHFLRSAQSLSHSGAYHCAVSTHGPPARSPCSSSLPK